MTTTSVFARLALSGVVVSAAVGVFVVDRRGPVPRPIVAALCTSLGAFIVGVLGVIWTA